MVKKVEGLTEVLMDLDIVLELIKANTLILLLMVIYYSVPKRENSGM